MQFSEVIVLYSEDFIKHIDVMFWQVEKFLHINA
jgi:hypothetical protein